MIQPLNSPVEVAIRVLVLINACYPDHLDVNRLVLFDYTLLHSADLGGPESIHPAIPGRTGEMGIKRTLIEQGLSILTRAGLVDVFVANDGIMYGASEDAPGFVATMDSEYFRKLTERAEWVTREFADSDDASIRTRLATIFSAWSEEFDSAAGENE
ncbi:hypothetical protein M4D79_25490 [Mycolicibacterium novocastrense]|nr:hypothetical protein M4D79_25490 [Mycolicibacterium novocastrense]